MVGIAILVVVAYVLISSIVGKVNWTIVLPIIVLAGVAVYFIRRKTKTTTTYIMPEDEIKPIDVNAPVELTGAYKCQACGGVTQINKTDTKYVCKFCGAGLLEAEKDAEQVRKERHLANQDLGKQRELNHERRLKAMELEKERMVFEAQKRETRSTNLLVILVISFFALMVFALVFMSSR